MKRLTDNRRGQSSGPYICVAERERQYILLKHGHSFQTAQCYNIEDFTIHSHNC
jgi:hypothetical protein